MDGDPQPPTSERVSDDPRVTRLPRTSPRYVDVPPSPPPSPAMTLGDIYYTLFRHKWKILLCSMAGILAAGALYKFHPPAYQSQAKLFLRYVVTGGKTLGPPGTADAEKTVSPDQRGETIMNSELEILSSLDLAEQVAKTVGPDRILASPRASNDLNAAASLIRYNLDVDVPPKSTVITIAFHHRDPDIVQPVLREVIARYLTMHVEIHRAVGIVGDFLTQETDQLRSRLAQTEEELRKARNTAGVISLDDAKKSYTDQMAGIRQEIFNAQAELAERSSVFQELTRNTPVTPAAAPLPNASTEPPPTSDQLDEYRNALTHLDQLRRREQELLAQFTEENNRVKEVRAQLADAESLRKKLEGEHPQLANMAVAVPASSASPTAPTVDLGAEAARVNALKSKIKVLTAQLDEIRAEATKIDQMDSTLSELRRRKDLEESNYKYYSASLEQARIDEALGAGRISNISMIQAPSPPYIDRRKSNKIIASIAFGGIGFGLAWAFLIEFYFDRSVRRPADVERTAGLHLFLSIPKIGGEGLRLVQDAAHAPLALPEGKEETVRGTDASYLKPPKPDPSMQLVRWEEAHALTPFYETLRDRLIGYFENKGLTHKPKLVAVTGLANGAGVTTTAAGLAKCFSETGEGNVLLVDMTVGQGSAQQFFKGKAVHDLDEVLDTKVPSQVQEKLYVVAEGSKSDKLSRNLPQRFNQLVPKLKASDFDYIIFDMPPVSQTSITPRLSGFMDMMLLVIESEKTDRDMVQRATTLLSQSNANVGAVLNKTKDYVPSKLHQDSLNHI